MLLGYPNSRLLLHNLAHRNVADPDAPEVRQLACELVMPTSALIEMAQTILTTLATNKATLEKVKQEAVGKYEVLVNGLPPVQPAVSVMK